jgi:hypothetical protein
MERDRTIDDVDDSVRVLQINCRLHKGKRDLDLNVSSLWQDDEGEMTMTRTRTILNPRSKMNSLYEIFGLS